MTKIEKVRKLILDFPEIDDLIHIDGNEIDAVSYGLYSNGQNVFSSEKDILGNEVRGKQLNFVFNVVNITRDDLIKLDNLNFLDRLISFVENYENKPIFGDFPEKETIELSNDMLFEDDGTTGTYQLQINITYYEEVRKNG